MRPDSLRAGMALALMAALLSGCFRYVPTELSDVAPQQKVRIQVSDEELPRLRAFVDVRTSLVSGRFLGLEGESATFRFETPVAYQEMELPRSSVLATSVREVDKGRSFALSVALVGGVGILAWLGFEGRGNEGLPGEGDADEARIPIFRLDIPF